ncbi:hypothetical protein COR50_20270 [Chitinophaga caeni]|uniref:Uncharacterized protein n=1 Tax=Chitinophaga caeni TaxID=2029983 RepID=A0A291QZL3_9BACT|nr:hypothetical protein COR50_20270 [Chitinophaga caeni]
MGVGPSLEARTSKELGSLNQQGTWKPKPARDSNQQGSRTRKVLGIYAKHAKNESRIRTFMSKIQESLESPVPQIREISEISDPVALAGAS